MLTCAGFMYWPAHAARLHHRHRHRIAMRARRARRPAVRDALQDLRAADFSIDASGPGAASVPRRKSPAGGHLQRLQFQLDLGDAGGEIGSSVSTAPWRRASPAMRLRRASSSRLAPMPAMLVRSFPAGTWRRSTGVLLADAFRRHAHVVEESSLTSWRPSAARGLHADAGVFNVDQKEDDPALRLGTGSVRTRQKIQSALAQVSCLWPLTT